MSDIIISNKTGAPIFTGGDIGKQIEAYQELIAKSVGIPRKYMGSAFSMSYDVTPLKRPLIPYTYPPFNKVVDYLISKEDIGIIEINSWTLRKDRDSIMFDIRRISPEVWEKIIKPEVQRHVQVVNVKHVRAWKSVKPKRMRLLIRRYP